MVADIQTFRKPRICTLDHLDHRYIMRPALEYSIRVLTALLDCTKAQIQ